MKLPRRNLMSRRGRKRKAVERHKGGKIIQPKPNVVALEARMRHHGYSRDRAKTREAGLAIGRALMSGELRHGQFEALEEWARAERDYHVALNVMQIRSASDFSRVRSYDGSDGTEPGYVAKCRRDIDRYSAYRRAALDAGPFCLWALQVWVSEDREDWRLIGDLRLAANAIRRYGARPATAS